MFTPLFANPWKKKILRLFDAEKKTETTAASSTAVISEREGERAEKTRIKMSYLFRMAWIFSEVA